jgi:hypothetical protein
VKASGIGLIFGGPPHHCSGEQLHAARRAAAFEVELDQVSVHVEREQSSGAETEL